MAAGAAACFPVAEVDKRDNTDKMDKSDNRRQHRPKKNKYLWLTFYSEFIILLLVWLMSYSQENFVFLEFLLSAQFLLVFLSLICGGILPQSERRQPGAVLPPENVFFWKTPTNKAAVNVFFWKTPPATTTAFSDSFMLSSVKRLSLSLCHRCRKSSNSG